MNRCAECGAAIAEGHEESYPTLGMHFHSDCNRRRAKRVVAAIDAMLDATPIGKPMSREAAREVFGRVADEVYAEGEQ